MATPPRGKAQHNPKGPLVFDTSRLGRRPGSMMPIQQTVPSPARIGLEFIAIDQDDDLELDLRLESVSEGVLVSGTVYAATHGECSRCLGPVTGDVEITLTELFAYPDSATESTTEEDEIGRVIDQTVNVEQAIVDAVGLALPFVPLCSDDCPGLCTECGVPLATAEPGHHHDAVDPRWAKLANLFPDSDDGSGPGRKSGDQ